MKFEPGTRVRRVGDHPDVEVPIGTLGTVIEDERARNQFHWIRVEWDDLPPNQIAAMFGFKGHLMGENEIEEL